MKASKIKSEINKLIKEIKTCEDLTGGMFGELGKEIASSSLKQAISDINYAIKLDKKGE